jgi:hypothetical protein
MKKKISVALSRNIVQAVDRIAKRGQTRSGVSERLLGERLAQMSKRARDLEDLRIINRNADRLNEEAEDVLRYQAKT